MNQFNRRMHEQKVMVIAIIMMLALIAWLCDSMTSEAGAGVKGGGGQQGECGGKDRGDDGNGKSEPEGRSAPDRDARSEPSDNDRRLPSDPCGQLYPFIPGPRCDDMKASFPND